MTERYPEGPGEDTEVGQRRSPWLYVGLTVLALAVVAVVAWLFVRPGPDTAAPATSTPPATTSTTSAPATTTASPSTSPPSPSASTDLAGFSTDPVTAGGYPQPGDPIGYGTAVRVGHHDGYDRVTFEFSGSGTPSYRVQYTDSPHSQGSGDPVQVAGDSYLQVTVTSVGVPDGSSPAPSMTTPATDGTVFAQVEGIWGGFEGYGETFLGINGTDRPFRVTVLQDPMRVVVDVANG